MSYNVFISYSRKDYLGKDNVPMTDSAVGRIVESLKQNKIDVWIDIHDHYAGENVPMKLAKQIREADNILFVSSHNSNESDWVAKEINYAYKHKKNIIPLRIDDTSFNESFDILLTDIDYIDFFRNEENAIAEIVKIITDETITKVPSKKKKFFDFN